MDAILFWLALLTAGIWVVGALEIGIGTRSMRFLRDVPALDPALRPRVSVVVAARDEAAEIESALGSLLRQEYSELEVIAVDDRSRDGTGEILDRIAVAEPRLRVVHVRELPAGWLGKNHALQIGANAAAGEWLLFTDADVTMRPDTMARAMRLVTEARVDHLAAAPELRMRSVLSDAFAGVFSLFFARYAKPWKARDPTSRHHIGVGAFNLVRAEAYRAASGHRPIALRPDDDLRLGRLLKRAGYRQDVAFGTGMISVPWYESAGGMMRGLEKNSFAGFGYSLPLAAAASLALVLLNAWPWFALLVTSGATLLLNLVAVLVMAAIYTASARASGSTPWGAILFPLASLFFAFVIVRSSLLAVARGGIYWRGTFYSLAELRSG